MEAVVPPAYTGEYVNRGGLRLQDVAGDVDVEAAGADLRHFVAVRAADELPRREEGRSLCSLLVVQDLFQPYHVKVTKKEE